MYLSTFAPVLLLPTAFAQLNQLAKARGLKYFGSATDNPELTDASYVAILSNTSEFGQITPGNSQKWDAIEPEQNTFTYSGGDQIVNLAEANGQLVRCHNLCWYSQLPGWVTSDSWTNATLIAALKNHIVNEVTHYKGKCYAWDVVNEAFNDDGTYRTDVFYNTIGPEYIPIAFETAAATDPSVKLYYNDYNIEYSGPKATAAQNLVKSLKARGIKIDGVGLQGHFIVGETPNLASQIANLDSFTALGVEVAYTELDIRYTSLPPTASGLVQQATDYYNTVSACLGTTGGGGCIGITLWDYTDKYSWIPNTFQGQGDACPWDANLVKKPTIYGAIVSALENGMPTSSAPSSPSTMTTVTTPTTIIISTPTTTAVGACSTSTVMQTVYVTMTSTLYVPGTSSTSTPPPPMSTPPSGGGGTAPHWGQCGGNGWTGATACASPYTCQVSNPWYSQCL